MVQFKEKGSYGEVNPFTGIWLKTRETVRYVIEEKSMGFVILLMILSGISSALVGAFDSEMNQMMPVWGIILGSIIAGPIFILLVYAIMAGVYFITGKLFKGTGTYTELFKAIGVAAIPQIWLLPVYLIWVLAAPATYFAEPLGTSGGAGELVITLVGSVLITVVTIWSIFINAKAIGEAHRISSWKGFFTIMIPSIVIGIIIVAIVVLIAILFIGFSV
ncbi:Yip1 family protein [Planococcus liqunii]|uniref:Yip1 family protein n=1 Tax=Planococcus liqunii TaxID=3058394 RepID=A0ABT8MT44_9BACL|nr:MULTISPECIES: Yip1 family protein [unclassified Planococcus (in: firmicutes)]MDN7228064.1 Yip1 family protein [Planococcus sp. N064]WKA52856.1 Yip1 family protein [Planococcus sp. N056]